MNGFKFFARGLGARNMPRAPCSTVVAAGDDGGITGGELAEAKKRLVKAERELDAAQEAVPVDAQRVAKAELGVAKAELGVAEAKLGVAESKWLSASEREKPLLLASVETAQGSVKTAQESVRTANIAYAMALNATTATPLQGESSQPNKNCQTLLYQLLEAGVRPLAIANLIIITHGG